MRTVSNGASAEEGLSLTGLGSQLPLFLASSDKGMGQVRGHDVGPSTQ